jgi:hypothetical protein
MVTVTGLMLLEAIGILMVLLLVLNNYVCNVLEGCHFDDRLFLLLTAKQ